MDNLQGEELMTNLGKRQKEVLEWLKEFGGAVNSSKIQIEKCDNGSHWSKCVLPALHGLVKRGLVENVTDKEKIKQMGFSNRVSSVWKLKEEWNGYIRNKL